MKTGDIEIYVRFQSHQNVTLDEDLQNQDESFLVMNSISSSGNEPKFVSILSMAKNYIILY